MCWLLRATSLTDGLLFVCGKHSLHPRVGGFLWNWVEDEEGWRRRVLGGAGFATMGRHVTQGPALWFCATVTKLCVTPCDTKPHYVLPRYHYGSCHGFDGSHVCHHGYPHRLWGGQPHKCGWHPMAIVPWSSVHPQPLMLCVTSDHVTGPSLFLSSQSLSHAILPDNQWGLLQPYRVPWLK